MVRAETLSKQLKQRCVKRRLPMDPIERKLQLPLLMRYRYRSASASDQEVITSWCYLHTDTDPPEPFRLGSNVANFCLRSSKHMSRAPQRKQPSQINTTTTSPPPSQPPLSPDKKNTSDPPNLPPKPNPHNVPPPRRRPQQSPAPTDQLHFQAAAATFDRANLAVRATGHAHRRQNPRLRRVHEPGD